MTLGWFITALLVAGFIFITGYSVGAYVTNHRWRQIFNHKQPIQWVHRKDVWER
jgi:hypothetical protein